MTIRPVALSIVFTVMLCGCGSREDNQKAHENEIVTHPARVLGDEGRIATVEDYLVVYSSPFPDKVYLYNWSALDKMPKEVSLELPGEAAFMGDRYIVFDQRAETGKDTSVDIFIQDVATGKQVHKFPVSKEWFCNHLFTNRTGTRVAVALKENYGVTGNFDHPRIRIGLIGPKADKISWITTLVGEHSGESTIHMAVPSDDGAYIGVGGWGKEGVIIIDVVKKKILWKNDNIPTPLLYDLCFTPDSRVVYTADMTECIVYGLDVLTGKVLSKWPIPEEGGFRIVSVAVSPDGRYVAAGTGPSGDVHVFSTKSGKEVMWIKHEDCTIYFLAFSPDSTMLATSMGSAVKIWEMPGK